MPAGNDILRNIYNLLMESQYWPPERMREYQQSQVAHLLRHARANVPFYSRRLDPLFLKDGSIDWRRWNEVPIVTRDELRDQFDSLRASNVPPSHGNTAEYKSSGSSGVPVRILVTGLASTANRAAVLRLLTMQGVDMRVNCATRAALTGTSVEFSEPYRRSQWGAPWLTDGVTAANFILNRSLSNDERLDLMEELNVRFLIEITNNSEVLARSNLLRAKPVQLDAVMCIGQRISPELKKLMKESFGARTISMYSSKEGGTMGYQCGADSRYHLSSEIVMVEVLDEHGKPCPAGKPGRVVITPFLSTALPLIRYDQGDIATLETSCPCGCHLPVLTDIRGRSDDLINLPNGPCNLGSHFIHSLEVDKFALAVQFAQVEPLAIEIRYVPKPGEIQVPEDSIRKKMRSEIHPDLKTIFCPMSQIPLNSGGKQQRVVRLAL